jgi:hypothetical protein
MMIFCWPNMDFMWFIAIYSWFMIAK